MDHEKLISFVRRNELLYNMCHKDYNDNLKKDKVWRDIGKELKQTGPACKMRWFNLRDQYRRALKHRSTPSGQSAFKRKKWKFESEMAFLKPYFKEREASHTTSDIMPDYDALDELAHLTEDEATQREEDISAGSMCEVILPNYPEATKSETGTSVEFSAGTITSHTPCEAKIRRKSRHRRSHDETSSSVLMKYIMDKNKDSAGAAHPIDAFLSGIAETIKTFPPMYQHMAKYKVFHAISKIEMEVLLKSQSVDQTLTELPSQSTTLDSLSQSSPLTFVQSGPSNSAQSGQYRWDQRGAIKHESQHFACETIKPAETQTSISASPHSSSSCSSNFQSFSVDGH